MIAKKAAVQSVKPTQIPDIICFTWEAEEPPTPLPQHKLIGNLQLPCEEYVGRYHECKKYTVSSYFDYNGPM